jgi:hypothetical protein
MVCLILVTNRQFSACTSLATRSLLGSLYIAFMLGSESGLRNKELTFRMSLLIQRAGLVLAVHYAAHLVQQNFVEPVNLHVLLVLHPVASRLRMEVLDDPVSELIVMVVVIVDRGRHCADPVL